jgi:hypothetical protein
MSDKVRPNGLYWVFFGESWTVAQHRYGWPFHDEVWFMIGDDFGRKENEIDKIGEILTPQTNTITTISGSKYNYTEQQGDLLVSYGFDTHKELSQHIMYERSK